MSHYRLHQVLSVCFASPCAAVYTGAINNVRNKRLQMNTDDPGSETDPHTADDVRDLKTSEARRQQTNGPTFDIMSDEETAERSTRILEMIDEAEAPTEDQ